MDATQNIDHFRARPSRRACNGDLMITLARDILSAVRRIITAVGRFSALLALEKPTQSSQLP